MSFSDIYFYCFRTECPDCCNWKLLAKCLENVGKVYVLLVILGKLISVWWCHVKIFNVCYYVSHEIYNNI